LKFLLLFSLLFNILLTADDALERYSLRVGYGQASISDLGEILLGDFGKHPKDLNVIFVDAGYLLKKDLWSLPLDLYVKSGVAYFDEYEFDDTLEFTLYVKLYWNMDFLDNIVRLGFAEGVSYTLDTLETEYYEAQMDEEPTSQFLNYLDISLDFDVGKLLRYKPLHETYFGYAIKHRSGVFGLYNGVHGGSNYNTLYLEKNF
jgi:outer membrane protein